MLDGHSIFFAAVVSQIVFTVILFLLALRDRSSVGTRWFAVVVCLQLVVTLLHRHLDGRSALSHTVSSAIMMVEICGLSIGVEYLTGNRRIDVRRGLAILAIAAVGMMLLWPLPLAVSHVAGRTAMVLVLAMIMRALLQPRSLRMRGVGRCCAAAVLLYTIVTMVRGILFVQGGALPVRLLSSALAVLATDLLLLGVVGLSLCETEERLYAESRTDELTGLPNRRAMEEGAPVLAAHAMRHHRALSLLLLDVDFFKRVNDTFGHTTGDKALHMLGEVLRQTAPPAAMLARVGGEEFAVLLPDTYEDGARLVAERLRAAVEAAELMDGGRHIAFTVSIGASALHSGERLWIDMLRRADKALYRAKSEGRNRVCTWRDSDQDGATATTAGSTFRALRKVWPTVMPEEAQEDISTHRAS